MGRLPNQNMSPGRPAKPPGMSPAASREWDHLLKELEDSGVRISRVHGRLIEQAAMIAADMKEARLTVVEKGAYFENEKSGAMQLHPAARRLDSLRRDYVKVLSLLGLRSIAPASPGKTGQSLDDILGG